MPSHRKGEKKLAVSPSSSEGQFRGGRSLEYGTSNPGGNNSRPRPSSRQNDTDGSINAQKDSNDWDHPPKGSDFAGVPGAQEYPRAPLSEGGIDTCDKTRRVNRGYQESSQYGSASLLGDGRERPYGSNSRGCDSSFPDGRGPWLAVLGPITPAQTSPRDGWFEN
ncbi:hypothetical protein HOY82DRAFT_537122 [Tuber indicum]|nr:hypothetical protein HOY82DRAFT_537122 [Tuber indicum]